MDETRLERLEQILDAVHQTVIRLEHDHGAKLEALFDGYDLSNQRLDKIENHLGRLDSGQKEIKIDIRDIKRTTSLLTSIAQDHESRLQSVEPS